MNSWASPCPGSGHASPSSPAKASDSHPALPTPGAGSFPANLTPDQQERLTGLLCHEIRTPLTVILGVLGLLQSGQLSPSSEQGQQLLAIAVKNIHRMTHLAQMIESHPGLSTILLVANDVPTLADQTVTD